MEPVLSCTGLVRRFGERVAVDDVSFEVGAGETYGLLGPNGAGKTTTIRLVCGLLRRDVGRVVVAGEAIGDGPVAAHRRVGYVPQDVALYPDLTAGENLRFFGRLYGLSGARLRARVDEVFALTGLAERAGDRVDSFSGGMKRRLNIGAALVHHPALLVLDEPTVGVDPQSRHAILEAVAGFRAAGMAVLYTTHYMEEAQRLCDRVGIIDRGRLVAQGSQRELVGFVAQHDRVELAGTGDLPALARAGAGLAGVVDSSAADGAVVFLADDGHRLLPALLDAAERSGVNVTRVDVVEPDLEAVFLRLTGTALRE